jgi:hypothetical protein
MFAKSKLQDMYRVEYDFHQRSGFENFCKTQSQIDSSCHYQDSFVSVLQMFEGNGMFLEEMT